MDFGLFTTWNAVYVGDKVPWDSDYRGGKLLEEAAKQKILTLERDAKSGTYIITSIESDRAA